MCRSKSGAVLVALLAASIALTACNSGGNTGSGGGSAEAIEIYDIGPNPDASLDPTAGQAGMEAAIKEVNDSGGINGRPIHVTFCNAITAPGATATIAAQCARAAANNRKVVADIGHISVFDQGDSIEAAAGLAVSGYTISPGDFAQPNWFPLGLGNFISAGQAAGAVQLLNATRLCFAYIDVPGVGAMADYINEWVLQPRNLSLRERIPLPPTASDLSPQAAQANGCDAVVLSSSAQQSIQYVKAIRSRGNDVPLILGPAVGPSLLKQSMGADAKNMYAGGWFYHDSPGFAQYQKDMAALNYAGTQYDDDPSIVAWAALKEFAAIAKTLPSVTREAVMAAYKKQSKVTTMGLTPVINMTVPQTGAGGKFPVVRNDTALLYQYEQGTYKSIGDPRRPFIRVFPGSNGSVDTDTSPFGATS